MRSVLAILKDIVTWIKGIADYPISVEYLDDTSVQTRRILTKYKSGKMIYESTRISVPMIFSTVSGNRYIDYMSVSVPEAFYYPNEVYIEVGRPNNGSFVFIYANEYEGGNYKCWFEAPAKLSSTYTWTNIPIKITGRWKA